MASSVLKFLVVLACIPLLGLAPGTAFSSTFACAIKIGTQGEVRYARFEADDAGEAYCHGENFAQNPGYNTCVPAQHAGAKTCVQMELDPVLERRRAGPATVGSRKAYQCPVPGTRFQEWAPVEASSADEIVSEMGKQFRHFNNPGTCLPAATYLALANPQGGGSASASPMQVAGTMTRGDIVATVQALDDLRVARARNAMHRRDTNDTAAVMARLQPVEASLAAEWAALPSDPVARVQQTLAIRTKYLPVLVYLQQQLAEQGPQNAQSPVLAIAKTMEPNVIAQIRAAMVQPGVKEAWTMGQLALPTELLPRALEREWAADRLTASLARNATAQTGATTVFFTRTDDQAKSRREREQAASWAQWGEPSANEIGLALLRAVSQDGGRTVTPSEAERVGPTHLLLTATGTAIAHATRVIHVQKTSCDRLAEGWSCGVRLWVQDFMRGASQDALKSLGGTFVHRADGAFRSIGIEPDQLTGRPARLRLAATQDGWTVPDFAAAIRADEQNVAGQMQRMADKAREEERCEANNIRLYGWDYRGKPCF